MDHVIGMVIGRLPSPGAVRRHAGIQWGITSREEVRMMMMREEKEAKKMSECNNNKLTV